MGQQTSRFNFNHNNLYLENMKLSDLLESYNFQSGSRVTPTFEQVINNGINELFDFQFPWYSDDLSTLADFKYLFGLTYYDAWIKPETVALFKLRMAKILHAEIPRYKQLYNSMSFDYQPLINRRLTEVTEDDIIGSSMTNTTNESTSSKDVSSLTNGTSHNDSETSGTSHNESSTSGTTKDTTSASGSNDTATETQSIDSDNPAVNFAGVDYAAEMNRGQSLVENETSSNSESNGTRNENRNDDGSSSSETVSDGNTTSNSSSESESLSNDVGSGKTDTTNERDVIKTSEGFVGSDMGDNIEKYRELILNLNKSLVDEFKECFNWYIGRIGTKTTATGFPWGFGYGRYGYGGYWE